MKKKNPALLITGLVLLIAGVIACVSTYRTSYSESLEYKASVTELKEKIEETETELSELSEEQEAEKNSLNEELDALNAEKDEISARKLSLERPYSYSLIVLFLGIIITVTGLAKVLSKKEAGPADIKKIAQAGLLAALCYIGFAFFKIDIPVGTEKTAFHLGNVFCVLAALLLGGFWGGLSGAVGMTFADLTTAYVTSAPKTFFLKLCIGLIVGLVAHKIFKLNERKKKSQILGITVLSSACGMAFNIVADPLVGYFYKTYLLGLPQNLAKALAKMSAVTTSVNAVIAVICATIFYLALRPALKRAGLLSGSTAKKPEKEQETDKDKEK